MPNNIKGIGVVGQRIDGEFHPIMASSFSAKEDLTIDEAKGYSYTDCATLQTIDTTEKERTTTVTLGTQSLDEQDLAWILFNQKPGVAAVIDLPKIERFVIPSATPYEVNIAGLLVDQSVDATIILDRAPGKIPLKQKTGAGAAAASEFKVAADKLVFNAAEAGRSILVYRRETLANKNIIGGINAIDPYMGLEIFGKVCGSRFNGRYIWFPKCNPTSGMNLDPKADEFTREFKALIPAELGFNLPYVSWN